MKPTRRQLLGCGGAGGLVVSSGLVALLARRQPGARLVFEPPEEIKVLLLNGGGASRQFEILRRALGQGVRASRITQGQTAGLAQAGLKRTRQILARARGQYLVAVVDDAEALVLEALLFGRVQRRGLLAAGVGQRGLTVLTGLI